MGKLPYDPVKDLASVAKLADIPIVNRLTGIDRLQGFCDLKTATDDGSTGSLSRNCSVAREDSSAIGTGHSRS